MTMAELETLNGAIEVFGGYGQIVKAVEEMSELTQALCKLLAGEGDRNNIAEEMADVEIMLEQLRIIMGNHAEVDLWQGCKLRHLARRVRDKREAIDVGTGSDTPPGGRADDDGE